MRKLRILLAIVLLIGLAGYLFGGCVLARSASAAGTAALEVPVSVGRVGINPFTGSLALDGLTVGNPPPFEARDLLRVDSFRVTASLSSALGSGPIEIPELTIDGLFIGLEVRGTSTNIGTLLDRLGLKRKKGQTTESSPGREVIIRKLRIDRIKVKPARQIPGLGDADILLPPIHIDDFSVGGKPKPLSEVVAGILGAIATELGKSATSLPKDIARDLGRAGETAAKGLAEGLDKGIDSIFDKLRGGKK